MKQTGTESNITLILFVTRISPLMLVSCKGFFDMTFVIKTYDEDVDVWINPGTEKVQVAIYISLKS